MANRLPRELYLRCAFVFAAAALCACHGVFDLSDPHSDFRLANLVGDSGGIEFSIGSSSPIGPIGYDLASNIVEEPEGSNNVLLTPEAAGAGPYEVDGVTVSRDTLTTLYAYGSLAGGSQGGFAAAVPLADPASGQVTMQAVVAAGGAQQSNVVYAFSFTPVGGDGQAAGISGSFGAPTAAQTIALAAGRYEIKVTRTASCTPPALCVGVGVGVGQLVFDSGPQGVNIPGGNGAKVFQLAAADASAGQQSQYGSAITLLLLDERNGISLLLDGQQ